MTSLEGETLIFIVNQSFNVRVYGQSSQDSSRRRSQQKEEARGGRTRGGRPTQPPRVCRPHLFPGRHEFVFEFDNYALQVHDVSRVTLCSSCFTMINLEFDQ